MRRGRGSLLASESMGTDEPRQRDSGWAAKASQLSGETIVNNSNDGGGCYDCGEEGHLVGFHCCTAPILMLSSLEHARLRVITGEGVRIAEAKESAIIADSAIR